MNNNNDESEKEDSTKSYSSLTVLLIFCVAMAILITALYYVFNYFI